MASTTACAASAGIHDTGVGVLAAQRLGNPGQCPVVLEACGILLAGAEPEHVGVDRSREDLDDPDAEGRDLHSEAVVEGRDCSLRRPVGGIERDGGDDRRRRDRAHDGRLIRPQGGDGGGGERHDSEHVGLEQPAPVVEDGVLDWQIVGVDACIVDKDTQVPREVEASTDR